MSDLKKSLPKRCGNEKLKARRQRSWTNTQARKEQRRKAQEAAHKHNMELVAAGLPTPHEAKKLAAKATKIAARARKLADG